MGSHRWMKTKTWLCFVLVAFVLGYSIGNGDITRWDLLNLQYKLTILVNSLS